MAQVSAPAPADQRGVTTITQRAVEGIAARAVAEVDLASGAPRRVLGIALDRGAPPTRVRAEIVGDVVTIRIAVGVRWPAPVHRVTRQVRAHVADRLRALTGLRVGTVDIDVPVLPGRAQPGRAG